MNLIEQFVEIYRLSNGENPDDEYLEKLNYIFEGNNFCSKSSDPKWFSTMIDNLIAKRESSSWQYFENPSNDPDIFNFFAELESFSKVVYLNHEESIELVFPFGVSLAIATADWYLIRLVPKV